MKKINIYIDTPYWFVRPKNTDWQYTLSLKGMQEHAPLISHYSKEHTLVLEENISWLKRKLKKNQKNTLQRTLKSSVFSWCEPDIIYSHGNFPITDPNIPTVWLYGVTDPDMRVKSGASLSAIESEYNIMKPSFDRASVVLCPTRAFAHRHMERFPKIADKFKYAPFFLNHIQSIEDNFCIEKHNDDEIIRFLFVGREAHRKGLDIIVEAFNNIPEYLKKIIRLDIVSNEVKSKLTNPSNKHIHWHSELSKQGVLELMRKSHVFLMPSRFETYGFVYLEAMASGCAVISASWESQREIFDMGKSGLLVNSNSKEVEAAIINMCDKDQRLMLAINGLNKFKTEYSPAAVSMRHHQIFSSLT